MDQDIKTWECNVCGEIVKGEFPPDKCPVCGIGRDKFTELDSEDYLYQTEDKQKFLIIGGGPAGTTAAAEIRKRNKNAQIEIIGKEDVIGYNRPMLTKGILKAINMSGFFIRDYPWYVENKIQLTLGKEVTALNPKRKTVLLDDGSNRKYDKLIIATGAESQIPPMPGSDLEGVFTIRTLADVEKLRDYIKQGVKRAAVIGGGVLGLESASELNKAGLDVTVIQRSALVMRKQLDGQGADMMADLIKAKGVNLKTGVSIEGIKGVGKAEGVMLGEGELVSAELVIISAGIVENSGLAEKAGAEVEKGIVVNEKMETSLKDVYAAGDCARFKGKNYALWPEATAMAKIAAQNAVGEEAIYEEILPTVSFVGFDTALFSLGDHGDDENKTYETKEFLDKDNGIYKKYYFLDKIFCGGILIGDTSKLTELLSGFRKKKSSEEMEL